MVVTQPWKSSTQQTWGCMKLPFSHQSWLWGKPGYLLSFVLPVGSRREDLGIHSAFLLIFKTKKMRPVTLHSGVGR